MSDFITTKAYAKVNLHLAVGKKATDGFHQIVSLFHKISLYDEIQIEVNKEAYSANIIVEMLGGPLVEQKDNLAYKAAALFYKNYQAVNSHTKGECKIKIVKNIPSGAGLGGGSSDAASVLMALNEIYNFPFSVGLLTQMATTLGSDLPFFFCEEAALVTGKGEKVKAYKSKEKPYILLAFPNVSINTKKAYSWVDEDKAYLEELEPQKRFLCSLVDKQLVWDNSFFNSFEIPVSNRVAEVKKALELLRRYNPQSRLSGSGSVCFSLFESELEMENVAKETKKAGLKIWQKKLL